MGPGIADLFMRPYNFKVWAVPTTAMQCGWLGERVATVDGGRAIANVIEGKEDAGWGPNAVFRFPKRGGTGAIWTGVASLLPATNQRYGPGVRVTAIDADAKAVTLACGARVAYDALLTTAPLDGTLAMVGAADLGEGLVYRWTQGRGVGAGGEG